MDAKHPQRISAQQEDQHFWNAMFVVLFLVLLADMVAMLWLQGAAPEKVSLFDVVIISLAVFRLTRLFVYDEVMEFFRSWFYDNGPHKGSFAGTTAAGKQLPEYGPRRTMACLLGCPWCMGMWMALIAVFVYFFFPWGWITLLVVAIAGVATFLQLLANIVGWKAEQLKRAVDVTK